jgi:hypothetical protein
MVIILLIWLIYFFFWNSNKEHIEIATINSNINSGIVVSSDETLSGSTLSDDTTPNNIMSWNEFNNGFESGNIDTVLKNIINNEKAKDDTKINTEIKKNWINIKYINQKNDLRNTKDYFLLNSWTKEWKLDLSYNKYNILKMDECKSCKEDCNLCDSKIDKIMFDNLNDISADNKYVVYHVWWYESCWSTVVQDLSNGEYLEFYCSRYNINPQNNKIFILWFIDDFWWGWWFSDYDWSTIGLYTIDNTNNNLVRKALIKDKNSKAVYSDDKYIYFIYSDDSESDTTDYLNIIDINTYEPILLKKLWKDYRNKALWY